MFRVFVFIQVRGLRFHVWGLRFRVWGLRFRCLVFRGLRFRVRGLCFRILGVFVFVGGRLRFLFLGSSFLFLRFSFSLLGVLGLRSSFSTLPIAGKPKQIKTERCSPQWEQVGKYHSLLHVDLGRKKTIYFLLLHCIFVSAEGKKKKYRTGFNCLTLDSRSTPLRCLLL